MKKQTFYFLFVFLFFSCKKDKFESIISTELSAYIDDFIAEGEKRGVTLSKERLEAFLIAELSLEREDNVCGLGWSNYNNQESQRIEILNNEFCWENRTDGERENLIFHELGHALLTRDHLNTTFPNGISKSIMCSGTDGFCSNFNVYYDNEVLKGYYLDELFDVNTPEPAFTQRTNFVRRVFEDHFEEGIIDWEEFIEGDPNIFEVSLDSTENEIRKGAYALKIKVKQSVIDEGNLIFVKRFELGAIKECSSLIFKADIRTEGELDGTLSQALSLRERLSDNTLNRFYLNSQPILEGKKTNTLFKDYALEMYCVTTRTNVVSVSFSIKSKLPVTIYIDNIRVELVE